VITVYSSQQAAFSKNHQRILEAVARQVAPTIQNSVLVAKSSPQMIHTPRLHASMTVGRDSDSVTIRSSILLIELQTSSNSNPAAIERLSGLVIKALRGLLDPADVIVRFNETSVIALLEPGRKMNTAGILQQTWLELAQIDLSTTRDLVITVGCASSPEDGEALQNLIDTARKAAVAVPRLTILVERLSRRYWSHTPATWITGY
jgi:hypothetical protein